MDHSYFKDRISGYFDRQLPPEEFEAVQHHLAECRECRHLLARMEKLDRLVERHAQLGGEEYWERSARAIEQRLGFREESAEVTDITPSSWRGLVGKLVAVAASVAILAFIALYEKDITDEVATPRQPAVTRQIAPDAEPPQAFEEVAPEQRGLETSGRGEAIGKKQAAEATEEVAVPAALRTDAGEDVQETGTGAVDKRATGQVTTEKPGAPGEELVKEAAKMDIALAETTAVAPAELGAGRVVPQIQPVQLEKAKTVAVSTEQAVQLVEAESVKADQFTVQDVAAEFPRPKTRPAAPVQLSEPQGDSPVASAPDTVSLPVGPVVVPDDWLQPVSLETWRQRRDSLQTLYADRTSPHLGYAAAKARREDADVASENIPELILYCHYQVVRLATDRDEREEAISHITRESDNPESPLRDRARNYLELLGISVE
jgi:hypothetical protein